MFPSRILAFARVEKCTAENPSPLSEARMLTMQLCVFRIRKSWLAFVEYSRGLMSSSSKGRLSEFQREDESRYQVEARPRGVKAPYLSIVPLSTLGKRLGRHPCRRIHVHTRGRTITEPASLSVIQFLFFCRKKSLTRCSTQACSLGNSLSGDERVQTSSHFRLQSRYRRSC